jgi:hypothetical protein
MAGKIAGANEFEVFLRVFGDQSARAELESVVILVFKNACYQQVHAGLVGIDGEFVAGGEGLDRPPKFFGRKRRCGLERDHTENRPGFAVRDFHVSVFYPAGGTIFGRPEAPMKVVTDVTSPEFFFHSVGYSSR